MRSHLTGLWFAVISVLALACSSLALAQAPAPKAVKPDPPIPSQDLSGIWGGVRGGPAVLRADKIPPMTPAAQAKFDENTAEEKKGLPITKDPAFNCLPAGVPHTFQNGAFAFEIVQTPKRIFILYESAHNWREIWMDGRQIPKDGDPTWMGYSVGHWDGNDLVVESGNFNDRTWLDPLGHPHSDALHVTERFHRPTYSSLQMEFKIDDPKSYTQPWTMKTDFKLRPGWEIGESFCLPEDSDNFEKKILQPNAK
jgi:hypothetical protein